MSLNQGSRQGVGHQSVADLDLPHEHNASISDSPDAPMPLMAKTASDIEAEKRAMASLDAKIRAWLMPGLRVKAPAANG